MGTDPLNMLLAMFTDLREPLLGMSPIVPDNLFPGRNRVSN